MLENKEIEQALTDRAKASPEIARQIAGICEGNYREAIQLMQHAGEDWQSLLREWLNATLKGGPIAQIKFSEEVSKLGREKQKQFLRYFNHLLTSSENLIWAIGPPFKVAFSQSRSKLCQSSPACCIN